MPVGDQSLTPPWFRAFPRAPQNLDSFEEFAAAINNDPNFAKTLFTMLQSKADSSQIASITLASLGGVTSQAATLLASQVVAQQATTDKATYLPFVAAPLTAAQQQQARENIQAASILPAFEGVPMSAFGHSVVAATNQTPSTSWVGRLSKRLGTVSGLGVTTGTLASLQSATYGYPGYTMAQIASKVGAGWTPPQRGLVGLMGLYNDVQYRGNTTAGLLTAKEGFRAILAMLTAGVIYGPSAVCFAYNGVWAAGPTTNIWGTASLRTTRVGDHVDASFNGDTCYVLLQGVSDTSGGTVTATRSGDGAQVGQITTTGYNDTFPLSMKLSGFGAGNHTVRLTLIAGTGFTFIGIALPNPSAPTVCWVKEAPPQTWLVGAGVGNTPAGNAVLAAYIAACTTIVADFPSLVSTPDAGPAGWDPASCSSFDGLHPNDKGSAAYARAAILALAAVTYREGQNWLAQQFLFADTPVTPAYTTSSATAPLAPSAVTGTTDHQLGVSWTQGGDGGATLTSQVVQTSTDGSNWTDAVTGISPSATYQLIGTGLTGGTNYYARVIGVNSIGRGTPSSVSTAVAAGAVAANYSADTFTRANNSSTAGSSETGSFPWWPMSGYTAGISSNQLAIAAAGSGDGDIVVVDGQANGTVQITIPSATQSNIGLLVRGCTSSLAAPTAAGQTLAGAYLLYRNGTTYAVVKRNAANSYGANLATATVTAAANDVLKCVMNGTSLKFYVNSTLVATVTDSAYTSQTTHGVWGKDAAALWDNWAHNNLTA